MSEATARDASPAATATSTSAEGYAGIERDMTLLTADELKTALLRMAADLNFDGPERLKAFFDDVFATMRENPYHNFTHICDVSQFCFTLLRGTNMIKLISEARARSLFIACVCHDLDHPGQSNTYQVNEKTELAVRYNNESVLENHHAATCAVLVDKHDFDKPQMDLVKRCILSTDMSKHGAIVGAMKVALGAPDGAADEAASFLDRGENLELLLGIVIKCCDISNQARPFDVATKWNERVYSEFYAEGDLDIAAGRTYSSPLHNKSTNNVFKSSIGFIKFVCLPLFETLRAALVRAGSSQPGVLNLEPLDEAIANMTRNVEINVAKLAEQKAVEAAKAAAAAATTVETSAGNKEKDAPNDRAGQAISKAAGQASPRAKLQVARAVDKELNGDTEAIPEASSLDTATAVDKVAAPSN